MKEEGEDNNFIDEYEEFFTGDHKIILKRKCSVCGKDYTLEISEYDDIPIWRFENCSKECRDKHSSDKILNKK